MTEHKVAAVVLAGGSGERFGSAEGKQIAVIAGLPVMSWSIRALDAAGVDSIVVVCHPERVAEYRSTAVEPLELVAPVTFAAGGSTRQASAAAGVSVIPSDTDVVLFHDGARPLIEPETVRGCVDALLGSPDVDGVVVGHPATDTVKMVDGRTITETPDRSRIWAVQTPQAFRVPAFRAALAAAEKDGFIGTDDASLVERVGGKVDVFCGPRDNIKVTVAEDVIFVEAVLARRAKKE